MIIRNMLQARTGLSQINDPNTPLYQALTGGDIASSSGVLVSQSTAMRVIAVQACVKLIAETIAALPLQTFNRGDVNREPIRYPAESYIWDQPNPEMTPIEFWEQVLGSMLLDGNAFVEIVRYQGGSQSIAELWPINPLSVDIHRTGTGEKVFSIDRQSYDTNAIWHIPAFRGAGSDRGMSPIGAARESIGVSLASEKLAGKFFGNGSVLSGLIETAAGLTDDTAKALSAKFNLLHQGTDNAFKVGILDNSAKFTQLSIPPGDLQFLESRKFQVTEIARLYQVPPHMIGDVDRSTSWGSGIEQQNIGFVVYSLLRWVRRTEQSVTKFLLPSRSRYARWNLSALMRGDSSARAAFYTSGRQSGWLSVNDIRRLEEMPPIEGGDDYIQPLNYVAVGSPMGQSAPQPNGARSREIEELFHERHN